MAMNPRHLAIQILDRVFRSDSFADLVLDRALKQQDFNPADRALTTELVYGTLRWRKWLDWVLHRTYHGDWLKMPPRIRLTLEVGLYQILFLDKIPDHAAVDESVKIAIEERGMVWARVVNGMLREIIRYPKFREPPSMDDVPVHAIAVTWSHPEWIVEKWIEYWGVERTISICKANNERPKLGVRVNRLQGEREEVREAMRSLGIEAQLSQFLDDFLVIDKGAGLFPSEIFQNGFVSIQDESAGIVARLVNPKPGEQIIDLTSAPGGKSMHMAERSRDKAIIVAADLHRVRLKKVIENKNRLGIKNVYPVLSDGRRPGMKPVDKVLIDSPCSGLGVLRRRGEMRWRRSEADITKILGVQRALLKSGASLVKPAGTLVYSTCSILPEENQEMVEEFLDQHPNFIVEDAGQFVDRRLVSDEGYVATFPDQHGIDGSFAVRMKRMK